MRAADAVPERFRALVLLCAFSGLRVGEALALEWKDVDLDLGTVRVRQQTTEVAGVIRVGPPKTRASIRTMDLPEVVVDALRRHRSMPRPPPPDGEAGDWVFASTAGTLQGRRSVQYHWRLAVEAVGLDGVRFHDIRHLAASLGTLSGATTKEQMARLGHATSEAALRYQHVLEGRGREVARGIDRLIAAAEREEEP